MLYASVVTLLLPAPARAEEPNLEGVHLALGVGLESAALGYSPGIDATSGVRIHVGPRLVVDLGGGAGLTTEYEMSRDEALNDAGSPVLEYGGGSDLEGLTAAGFARVLYRVNRAGPVGFHLGVGAGHEVASLEGPYFDDVEDPESGEATLEEVGTYEETQATSTADLTLEAIHWVTPRLALSGVVTASVYERRSRNWQVQRTDGEQGYGHSDNESDTFLGFRPEVGLALHLLL